MTGNAAVQQISYMKAGSYDFFEIKTIPGLSGMTVYFDEDDKNDLLVVEEDPTIPFEGNVYSKFTFSARNPPALAKVEFTLKIPKEELQRKEISPADLRLWANGKELETTPISKIDRTQTEQRYLYYTATSTESGQFVIGQAAFPPQLTTAVLPQVEEQPAATAKAVEEQQPASEPVIQEPVPVVGEAVKLPPEQVREIGWFQRIKNSLKRLLGK